MMRIRTVKPAFFQHRRLFLAERETGLPLRIFFEGLWCAADREGRFAWQPDQFKLNIIPYDDAEAEDCLDALAAREFIVEYWHQGKRYGHIPSFTNHQHINPKEAASTLPDPRIVDGQKLRRIATEQPALDLGLPDAPERSTPKPRKRAAAAATPTKTPSWSYRACQLWENQFGNVANGGQIGRFLKPLVEKLGEEAVLSGFENYLRNKDPEFASPADFAKKPNLWMNGSTPQPTNGRQQYRPRSFNYTASTSPPKEMDDGGD